MEAILITFAYLAASVLFILSLRALSSPETAARGNLYGVVGMAIAIGATLTSPEASSYGLVIPALLIGGGYGVHMARKVEMTAMPELVALLHSFVGLAAVLVGFAIYVGHQAEGSARSIHQVETYLAVVIGALTFTGSVLAFLKLKGTLGGKPLMLPGRHLLNLGALVLITWFGMVFTPAPGTSGMWALLAGTVLAGGLGWHMVAAIGGADMPVVVSLLNSYSGWTASAAGFMLGNDLLIVTGALVGSSGAILSYIMCKAMNRTLVSVVLGGFGSAGGSSPKPAASGEQPELEVTEASAGDVSAALLEAKSVIVVPGYGMAVARAQHAVREITEIVRKRGGTLRFAVHPVAGRLPGHMNVLLAEANVPYDIVLEMDEINADFADTDVVLVVGANDICNPGALTDEASPIYGMPVLEVWDAKRVFVLKRSRAAGYAGVDNPLFYLGVTDMVFGDARDTLEAVVGELRQA